LASTSAARINSGDARPRLAELRAETFLLRSTPPSPPTFSLACSALFISTAISTAFVSISKPYTSSRCSEEKLFSPSHEARENYGKKVSLASREAAAGGGRIFAPTKKNPRAWSERRGKKVFHSSTLASFRLSISCFYSYAMRDFSARLGGVFSCSRAHLGNEQGGKSSCLGLSLGENEKKKSFYNEDERAVCAWVEYKKSFLAFKENLGSREIHT
jgi:hypothetical protein